VTAHDGFTLRDLVSYNEKHNAANGEENRDGESHNRSWNCGVEGPTQAAAVQALRARQQRNFLATLLLSQGVPMLLGGDELGRTQQGNNNAYCQDNEISWFDWENVDQELLEFTRHVISLRREHPVFRRQQWFFGRPIRGTVDIGWCRPDGSEMGDEDWSTGFARAVGVFLNGNAILGRDPRGQRLSDDSFLMLLNAHHGPLTWTVPKQWGKRWEVTLDTRTSTGTTARPEIVKDQIVVGGRTLVLLRRLVP
jgi:Type II secretory pathway, pullulanase PulA and related glycosidases